MTPTTAHLLLTAVLASAGSGAPGAGDEGPDIHSPAPASVRSDAPARAEGPLGRLIRSAGPGDTVVVPAGTYREHLRIDKPLSLVAGGTVVIDGEGSGDIVEVTAPGVTIRGFTIRNTGIDLEKENAAVRVTAPRVAIEDNVLEDILFGIDLRESPDSRVVGNRIGGKALDVARRGDGLRLWRADRAVVERNTIHDGRDAILWYSTGVVVRGNSARNCRYALHLMFSDAVTITGNEFAGNSVGVYLMYSTGVEITANRLLRNRGPSGYGIGLKETDKYRIRGNLIAANRAGVYIDGSPFTTARPGDISGNTLAYNDVGMTILPSARGNEIVGNNFIDNIDQVAVSGRGNLDANRFWKGERGNFWSDYTGFDRDGDGVGDYVHESATVFDNLLEKEPSLRLMLFSPAQQAIEFVGRALPAVRPEPKFSDEVPLMRPVPVGAVDAQPVGSRAALLVCGLALSGTAAGVLLLGRAPAHRSEVSS